MSEMIAMRMATSAYKMPTVSRVRRREWAEMLTGLAAAAAGAAAAERLLRPRRPIPEPQEVELAMYFSAHEIARGRAFTRPQLALGLLRSAVDVAVLARLSRPSSESGDAGPGAGALAAARITLATALPAVPVAAVARRRALRYGLATGTWRAWGVDLLKARAISTGLAAATGEGLAWLVRRRPRDWWLPAASAGVGLSALGAGLAPVLLDPLFNDFQPLEDEQTREQVLALTAAAGLRVRDVLRVDASRRTNAANAYVAGLGPSRRVVLFDTLLERYTRREVRAVVAHELAHVQGRDVLRGIAFGALLAPGGALAVQRLAELVSGGPVSPASFPAVALAGSLLGPPGAYAGARLSRALERRADAFALELSDDPEAFISFERKIAVHNLADLDPPRWVKMLLATHPPTAERIGMALSYAKQGGRQAAP
jgi:STE24 endopeptidase